MSQPAPTPSPPPPPPPPDDDGLPLADDEPATPSPPPPAGPGPSLGRRLRDALTGRSARAVAFTWVAFLLLNFGFGSCHFAHLERYQSPTLDDWSRDTRVGYGASRAVGQAGATGDDWLMPQIAAFRGRHDRLFDRESNSLRITPAQFEEARRVYQGVVFGKPPVKTPESPIARHAKVQIELLRLRHEYIPEDQRNKLKELAGRQRPQAVTDFLKGQPQFNAKCVHDLETGFWEQDPLALSPVELRKLCDVKQNAIHGARESLAKPTLTKDEQKQVDDLLRSDLRRLRPFDANPDLALIPIPATSVPTDSAFTVAFFPIPPTAVAAKKGDPVTSETESSGRSVPLVFCLEVFRAGSWWSGEVWEGRFLLLDSNNPQDAIANTRDPVVEVLQRRAGWVGLRPTAVKVTEEQLASRFFPVLKQVCEGAGVQQPPDPDDAQKDRFTAFIERAITVRLGGDTGGGGMDTDQHYARRATASDWIKWPRRFNGGTWWGFIQFFVVLLTFRFFLDWVPAWRSLRQAERENRAVDERRRLVRDRSQTLTLIVVLLPLIGFLGTVAGLSESLVTSAGVASDVPAERQSALTAMQIALGTAFDKSMLAFSAVIVCTSFRHWLFSRAEH